MSIERILVPLDLNRLSEAKVPVAEAQARAFDAEILLLHILPPSRSSEVISVQEAQARTYLDAITARLRSEGIKVRPLIRSGAPAETILQEIEAQRADLVILGSNVRRGLSRLLLGSVAEEIVAKAPCPVLLIRPTTSEAPAGPAVRSFSEDAASAGPVAPRSLGIRVVEVARIIGSVGRANELDGHFRSVSHRRAEEARYERVRKAMEEGVGLPPVVLYKLGYGYYVLDGNHRVAAAKQLGQLEIEATVTEYVPLSDPQAQRVFAERRAFEQETGLTRIGAALPGHYPRLAELIRTYAREHSYEDLKEAASRWESEVYRTVAQRIRVHRLKRKFAGERTADIFVTLEGWREEQAKSTGRYPDWEEAIDKYTDIVAAFHSAEAEGTSAGPG